MIGRVTITAKCGHGLGAYLFSSDNKKAIKEFVKGNAKHLRKTYGKTAKITTNISES